MHLEPAAFIFFRFNKACCNQQKTNSFSCETLPLEGWCAGTQMEKILLLLETSSSLDKNLILTVIPAILAHSYSNHGEEGGGKDGLLMQAHTQQQQTTSQEVT